MKQRRRADRAYRGPYRSPSMVRTYYEIRTRQAAAVTARQRRTVLQAVIMGRLGVSAAAAARLADSLAELLAGKVDEHGLSRVRQTTAAARLGVVSRTVQRHLARLLGGGLVVVHAAPRRPVTDDAGRPTGEWEMTGANGYELSPWLLDELIEAENANRPQHAKDNTPARATQRRDYRDDSTVVPSPSDSRRPALHDAGPGLPTHPYADDGYGSCIACPLPGSNRVHRPALAA